MITLWDEVHRTASNATEVAVRDLTTMAELATVTSICDSFGVSVQFNENGVECPTDRGAIVCRVTLGRNAGMWVALGGVDALPDLEWHAVVGALRHRCPEGIYYYG